MMRISFAVVGLCHDIVMMRESSGVNRERDMLATQRQKRVLDRRRDSYPEPRCTAHDHEARR